MSESTNKDRRRLLVLATSAAGAIAGIGTATPFVLSMTPSARARAAGAPVEVDLAKIEPGMMITAEWRGKPVWILHRTEEMIGQISRIENKVSDPASKISLQPGYAQNKLRALKPEFLVLIGICTHLGCVPAQRLVPGPESGLGEDWTGGFYCPCHGSRFDLAGRVYKGSPAPTNLEVPPYSFVSDSRLVIGVDSAGA